MRTICGEGDCQKIGSAVLCIFITLGGLRGSLKASLKFEAEGTFALDKIPISLFKETGKILELRPPKTEFY